MVERFSDEFIETRRKALHKFLNRIADHPTLTFNEDFKIFLTAQAWVKWLYFYLQFHGTTWCVSNGVWGASLDQYSTASSDGLLQNGQKKMWNFWNILSLRKPFLLCISLHLVCDHKYYCIFHSSFCCCVWISVTNSQYYMMCVKIRVLYSEPSSEL